MSTLKKTALYAEHIRLGAKVIEFGGWMMPVQYSNVIDEHTAVRTKVGLFDICHMGEIFVRGADALEFLQHIASNDISLIETGKSAYSVMCNPQGGTVDDIFVYCFDDDSYLVVVNASTSDKDYDWMKIHSLGFDVIIENKSDDYAMLSIQGPYAEKTLQKLTKYPLMNIKRFEFVEDDVLEIQTIISRTGYTGEDGFEIFFDNTQAVKVWNALLESGEEFGIKPIGLGARDTLRLESCYSLYGHELSDTISPLEAGVGFAVKLDKKEFIGKDILMRQNHLGVKRRIAAFEMKDNSIPRNEYEVFSGEKKVGYVTSGTFNPSNRNGIGLAMIDRPYFEIGAKLDVKIRNELHPAIVIKKPFYSYTGKKY